MTHIKWKEDSTDMSNSNTTSDPDTACVCRCDPDFLVLWKLEEWKEGDFHAFVRETEENYFAFVKFCVPIVTGVTKWKNDLKCAIWNSNKHTLKSCGMLTEAEEGFAALIVENGWERWNKEAKWRHDKGIAYDANTKLKNANEVFGIYKWSDGGTLENTDGKKGRHDWSHSGLQRFHDIRGIIRADGEAYDFNQNVREEENGANKSLLFKFRDADVKWKQVNKVTGAANHAQTGGNAYRAPSLEDKASKRQRRNDFLDSAFVTNWGEV